MKELRVGMVCGDYDPTRDGVSAYTERLARALGNQQVDVVLLRSGRHERPEGPPARGGEARAGSGQPPPPVALVSGWRLRHLVGDGRRIRRIVKGLDLDLVHVQFAPSAYGYRPGVGLLPLVLPGSPLVVTLHEYGWWSWQPRWAPAWLAEASLRRAEHRGWWDRETLRLVPSAAAVITTNQGHAGRVTSRLPRLRAPVAVIPIGTNVDPATRRGDERPAVRAEMGAPGDAPLLVFFGFVHPVKGVRYLLEATARLRARRPSLRLALVGGFESLALRGQEAEDYRREVGAMITGLGLEESVRVTGWVDPATVSRFLYAADVVTLPFTPGTSAKSGALLAAFAHGAPVVATVAPDPDPALVHRRHALLVPPRDTEALGAAVEEVLGSASLRNRLRDEGLAFAAGRRWDSIAAAHREQYQRVLGPAPPARRRMHE